MEASSAVITAVTKSGTNRGTHGIKAGGVLSFLNYDVQKLLNANPVFRFLQQPAAVE